MRKDLGLRLSGEGGEHSVNPFGGDPRQFIWRVNQVGKLTGVLPPDLLPFPLFCPPLCGGQKRGKSQSSDPFLAKQPDSPAAQGSGGLWRDCCGFTECSPMDHSLRYTRFKRSYMIDCPSTRSGRVSQGRVFRSSFCGAGAPRRLKGAGRLQWSCRRFPALRAVLLRAARRDGLLSGPVDAYLMRSAGLYVYSQK